MKTTEPNSRGSSYRVAGQSPWPSPRGPGAGPGAGAVPHTGSTGPPFYPTVSETCPTISLTQLLFWYDSFSKLDTNSLVSLSYIVKLDLLIHEHRILHFS